MGRAPGRDPLPFALLEEDEASAPVSALEAFAREHGLKVRFAARLARAARAALRERGELFGPAAEALFDLVADSELLPLVAPGGRVGRDFASRCLAAARLRSEAARVEERTLRIAKALLTRSRTRRSAADRGARDDGADEWTRSPAAPPFEEPALRPRPDELRRLARLARRAPGDVEEGLARGEIALPGTGWVVDRRGRAALRSAIPGSSILIAPPLVTKGARVVFSTGRTGKAKHAAAMRRLGLALGVLDSAWPEAARETRARTRLVLPLDELGLVSFSMASRPGVSYINLRGKSVLDLADDLLHETAHHRLHAIESRVMLFARTVPDSPGGGDLRYWSPWRRSPRPVRGIFHSCYTFAFRAELLGRIARTAGRGGGRAGAVRIGPERSRALSAEARAERRRIARSLHDLREAAALGALTKDARRLADRIGQSLSGEIPRAEPRRFSARRSTARSRERYTEGRRG